jgi:hypothetical protein
MKTGKRTEILISKQWPKLKNSAQNETDPEKLIRILEEIEDLLFNLEMRLASEYGKRCTRDEAPSLAGIFDREIGSE